MWTLRGQQRADDCEVVVVGAGLVGAAVAARLVREGIDTAVLEARTVAGGATGRSAGMVLTGLAGHYNWAVSAYGRQQAREVWALTVEGRRRLVETAGRLDVPLQRTGSLALAVDGTEAEALEESAQLLHEDGFDGQFEPQDPLERGFHGALRQPDDVTVDAAALTQALLAESGAIVHESTEVYDLARESDGLRVWALDRTVICNTVVLAVNGYASLLDSYFADKVAPTRSLVLASKPLDGVALELPCCADYGYEYCRQLSDRRLLLGGWRRPSAGGQVTGSTEVGDAVRDGLARFASRHFPEVETEGARRWSGVMGLTPDGLPLLGQLDHLPRVYFAVGLGGRGLAWAFVIAERLVDLILRGFDPGILAADRLT